MPYKLPTDAEEIIPRLLQDALAAIHSNRIDEAHRYLLKALRADPQNIQIWWLLGWTAPTSASAVYYFDEILEKHPDNILAREILQWRSHKSGKEAFPSGSSVDEAKQLIIKAITFLEKSEIENQGAGNKLMPDVSQTAEGEESLWGSATESRRETELRNPKNFMISLAYLAALTLAETLTTLSVPQVGLILHGVVLLLLILHAALFAERSQQRFLMTLTLAPLIRLMSLSVPLLNFPTIYWYAIIGAPLIAAAFIVLRMTGFTAASIGLKIHALPSQLFVGITGFGLGYLEYIILRPTPLIKALTWQEIWLPALILLIFTGFLEEIIFRGLIQRGAVATLGRYSIIYVSVLFAVLHFGYRSVLDVVFVLCVALFFSVVVARTGSLLGVTLAHGLTNISLYLIIPFLINPPTNPITSMPQGEKSRCGPPVAWLMQNLTADLTQNTNKDVKGIDGMPQAGYVAANSGEIPDWVQSDDYGAITIENRQQGLNYFTDYFTEFKPIDLNFIRAGMILSSFSMVTVE